MKILLLDDEEIYAEILKICFKNHTLDYEPNPVLWLDKIDLEKTNLNEYDYIFCDYYFNNLSMNSFELKLSKYIRNHGFEKDLILFSNLTFFTEKELNQEYFDLVLDKMKLNLEKNIDFATDFKEKCAKSPLKGTWRKQDSFK